MNQQYDQLLNQLSNIFDEQGMPGKDVVEEFLHALELGSIRCAHKAGGWQVDARVKKGILLAFRLGVLEASSAGPLSFVDKHNLWPRRFDVHDKVRIAAGGASVRRGAHIGQNVVIMPPSFVNIGSFVDEGSMVDSNALVGSCAQVGKRVHISAGVQLGGVLEPLGAHPVIIEDDVMLGGHSGIFEGCIIGQGAVIGAGVILTKSTKVFDLVNEKVLTGSETSGVVIPPSAVVVPGARAVKSAFAESHCLSIATPLIIKYRNEKTDDRVKLEEILRK